MHIELMIVGAFVVFGLGYAFRGAIRRDLALVGTDAEKLATRLETAVKADAAWAKDEILKVAAELRAKL